MTRLELLLLDLMPAAIVLAIFLFCLRLGVEWQREQRKRTQARFDALFAQARYTNVLLEQIARTLSAGHAPSRLDDTQESAR